MKSLPRFDEFLPLLRYDIRQVFNAMYYSHLITTKLEVMNLRESRIYLANDMMHFVYTDLDDGIHIFQYNRITIPQRNSMVRATNGKNQQLAEYLEKRG